MFYSREKTIEKLSKWLTPVTIEKLAAAVEHAGDASGLYGYLEYMAGQLDNDDAVAVMAEDMIDEW